MWGAGPLTREKLDFLHRLSLEATGDAAEFGNQVVR